MWDQLRETVSKEERTGASLAAQWQRICLALRGSGSVPGWEPAPPALEH